GYRRVFEEYAHVVQQRYPHLSISGNNYPAPKVNNYIAKASNILKWSALAIITLGERVSFWQNLNIPNPPEIYQWTQNHKIMSCVGVFFIGNTIENGLLQTGAFEIYFNDVLIWSKLKTQKLPSVEELLLRIKNNMDDKKMSFQEDKFESPISNDREHKKSGEFDEFDKNDFGSENTVDLNNQYEF
ncbi:thioredoxin reductase-like selenoprotein T isoform X2, partial [Hydra vulgaris]|uniref:Thioredoxin reductase-like selenoprotein T isoform X2 n=1 Tax=Hydra vulgaris TaxID=6087 RepID=A0ABM4B6X7_HYDVU